MRKLTLHPGPRLLREGSPDDEAGSDEDVTARAVEFLFDLLVLADGVRLGDLLGLLGHCPALQAVYRRLHAEPLADEAALGPVPDGERSDLLFIELHQTWDYDSHLREYSDVRRLHLSGAGHPGAEEYSTPEKDGLIRYSLSGAPVRPMLHLPLRLKTEVAIQEADFYSTRSSKCVSITRCRDLFLGELLQAVIWELTWFGPPGEAQTVLDDLVKSEEEFNGDAAPKALDFDSFMEEHFGERDRRGCEALFESIGTMTPTQIANALRTIPDGFHGKRWLARNLGKQVKLRPAFRRLKGRDLRQAFWEA